MKPNTIVQFWNTPDLPEDISRLVGTWKANNPSMEYKLFSYKEALDFIGEYYGSKIQSLYKSAALPAMQSDIFRVAYCLKMGGFYIDCGVKCNSSIEPLLSSDSLLLVRKWHGGIWNGAIGCNAGHPALAWIWDRIIQNLKERNSNDVWKLTGPLSFNQMVESQEFATSVNVFEQRNTKPFFDIVNDLEHKKKHWSKEQETRSVFLDEVETAVSNVSQLKSASSGSSAPTTSLNRELVGVVNDVDTSNCEVVVSGGFEKEQVSRLVLNVSNMVLFSGVTQRFPIIINKRGKRSEVEFYAPTQHRQFPLQKFVNSGNNGVTDYMLVMPEQTRNNAFYKLSTADQASLIAILRQLQSAFSKQHFSFENDASETSVGSIEMWLAIIEELVSGLCLAKTKEVAKESVSITTKVLVQKLTLITNSEVATNELKLRGDVLIEGFSQPSTFEVLFMADNLVSKVLSVSVNKLELKPHTAELVQAIAKQLHKTNCRGLTPSFSLERWYYAMCSFNSHNCQ